MPGPITSQSQAYLAEKAIHHEWESEFLNADLDRFYDLAFDRLVHALRVERGASVLDAGCGYGFHAIRMARSGLNVTGVDFSDAALSAARANVERAGVHDRVTLFRADLLHLPFPDRSFPYVNCWGVLMHIPEVEAALLELARVLSPAGRIALMENDMRSLHVRFWEPLVRTTKQLLGRRTGRRSHSERGIEEWLEAETGGLMVRKTDLDWLIDFYAHAGLKLIARFPSQFTELYLQLPLRSLKRAVYAFNERRLRQGGHYQGSLGQVLVFEKC
jgi:ubiquinone/menaquinone biosynthesis C-methylase UbiE